MLKTGDTAPAFSLPDQSGNLMSLADFTGSRALVLYFYPADFTPGGTKQACGIRDMHKDFEALSLPVLAISPQSEDSHARFASQHQLPFPLLVDADKSVIKAYQVNGPLGFGVRRVTYLISPEGIIIDALQADFRVDEHLSFLKRFIQSQTSLNG